MKGWTAMKQLTNIDDRFIQNACLPDEFLDDTGKLAPEKPRHYSWHHSTGWLAAGICAMVGIGVYVALIGLGRGWFGHLTGPAASSTTDSETVCEVTVEDNQGTTAESDASAPFSEGLDYTSVAGGYAVAGIGSCTDTDIVIPSTYLDKPVIAVSKDAFKQNKRICSVTLPDSMTSIGAMAFNGCSTLISIRLPENSSLKIDEYAFAGCTSLTSIHLYDGTVTTAGLFSGCTALNSVRLPADITKLWDKMFEGCVSLTSIELPDGLIAIGNGAFERCTTLSTIIFPETLVSINSSAFAGCTSLHTADIRIPQSVNYIGLGAFDIDGGMPDYMVTPEGEVLLMDGSPFGTYECYVDHCLIYVYTTDPTYTVREGTRLIADGGLDMAMLLNHDEKTIILPNSLEYLCGTWISPFYNIVGEYTHLPVTDAR